MSFFGSSTSITHAYSVCDAPIPRASLSKDLGVFFDPSLSFKEHTNYVINKANKSLGYICRMSTEIRDPFVLSPFIVVRSVPYWNMPVSSGLLSNYLCSKEKDLEAFYEDRIS